MRIIVDGDACPDIDLIESIGNKYNIEVIIFCDFTHQINSNNVIYTDKGYQSVDMVIINYVKENDLVITQDYGLAALVLSKKCKAIDLKGYEYSNDEIASYLETRHINNKVRKHYHLKGISKRNIDDTKRLEKKIMELIGG